MHAVEFSRIGCSCGSASRLPLQGNFSILFIVKCLSNRRFSTRSRRPATASSRREIRCSAVRLSRAAGQLLYLIPLALLVKSAVRDCFSVSGQHSSTATRSGNLHPRPKGTGLSTRASRWGVVLRLRGVRLSGLSASLWGEQVISYVGSGGWANRGRTPGVSRCLPPVIPRIRR